MMFVCNQVILKFVGNQVTKSREILMFVCLQKDSKQCCDVTNLDRAHCAGRHLLANFNIS